jgi:ankyrin repeat protein
MKPLARNILRVLLALSIAGCGQFDSPQNRLVNAARNDDLATFRKTVSMRGVTLDAPETGMLGYTPIMASVLADGTNVFHFILGSKVDVNAKCRGGETALILATLKGDRNSDRVLALIQRGADVNAKDHDGASVLQHAIAAGGSNVVRILQEHGSIP